METYQGWTNHATWVVSLWLDSTETAYKNLQMLVSMGKQPMHVKADNLRDWVTLSVRNNGSKGLDSQGSNWAAGIKSDLADDESLADVNWTEIIESTAKS